MLTNDVDLREANERRQPKSTVGTRKSRKKKSLNKLGFAVDMNNMFANRDNWFCQTKFL